jgi:hypothetical protein
MLQSTRNMRRSVRHPIQEHASLSVSPKPKKKRKAWGIPLALLFESGTTFSTNFSTSDNIADHLVDFLCNFYHDLVSERERFANRVLCNNRHSPLSDIRICTKWKA